MSRKVTILFLLLIFLITSYSITLFLRPADIISNTPIYTDDYALHYYHCLATQRFLSTYGKCWGYDPFLLAGYPSGGLTNVDNKAWELLYFLIYPILGHSAFKIYLFLFFLLYPFFIYCASRNFKFARETSLLAAFLAILFFHLSLPIEFVAWGMLSYVFVAYFSIYIFSLFYKLFELFNWKRYVILIILTSIMFQMHILSPVHIFIPIAIIYIFSFRKLSVMQHVLLALLPIMVFILNSYWLIPFLEFFNDKGKPETYGYTLQIANLFEPFNVYLKQQPSTISRIIPQLNNSFIEVILAVLSVYGVYAWWRERRFNLFFSHLSGILFVFLVAYYGSNTNFFLTLQPQRFTIPLNLLFIIPASHGMYLMIKNIFQINNRGFTLCFSCIMLALLVSPVFKPLYIIYRHNLYRLQCDVPKQLLELLNYLKYNTTREGRILIEDSEFDTKHQFFGCHFPGLFPEYVKREFLCGPRPMYTILHSYASFTSGVLFEKKLENYSLVDLQRYFDSYNVKWIVCWRKESKEFFNKFPRYISKLSDIDRFTIYEVKRKTSFFIKGSGTVHSDYNSLELTDIVSKDREIIVSYHWMQFLKTIPPLRLEKTHEMDDPVGFIRIIDPPKSLKIINGY